MMTLMPPLDGVTVLDLTTVGPGARCAAMLADLGADVVKVIPPAGANRIVPSFHAYSAGRGSRRRVIDLKEPQGVEAFLAMAAAADAVVEGMRPGVADRLGIGYEAVRAHNPRIVYASLTGFGQDGPYAQRAGHDLNYQAVAGALWCTSPDAEGKPALPGATFADSAGGGMQAALAICAALVAVQQSGEGRHLDVSATEGVLSLMSLLVDEHLATGVVHGPGSDVLTGKFACYGIYACADGRFVSVGAIERPFFANLCRLLGRPDLTDRQYEESGQDDVRAALAAAFKERSRDEWVDLLADADTCVAPVLTVAEVAQDRHHLARGVIVEAVNPDGSTFRQLGPVLAGAPRPLDRRTVAVPPDATEGAA